MHEHDKEQITDVEKVACEVCLKKIPASEAKSAEATDYIAYFCGLDCYDKWKHQKPSDKS